MRARLPPTPYRRRRPCPGCGRDWRRHLQRLWVKPWFKLSCSGLEDVQRALNHAAGGADDVEVRLVGSLRVSHIGHFDQWIDVGVFDVTRGIGGGIARIMLDAECGLIRPDFAKRYDLRIQRAIEFGGKR